MKKEEKKEKTEKKKKLKLKLRFKILIIFILFMLYLFLIAPKGVFIKEYSIKTNKIDEKMHGLKIAHFSDLRYGSTINSNNLESIVNKINETKPDIVIFTGNLVNKNYSLTKKDEKDISNALTKINSRLGNFYVKGNLDTKKETQILDTANFIDVNKENKKVYFKSNKPIILTGKNTRITKDNDEGLFNIFLLHNPKELDKYKDITKDIILSGHTLNGQVNIPKLKELFIEGKYTKEKQKIDNTTLFINRGLGTSNIKIRLFNHPAINLYRIKHIKKEN